MLEVKTIRKNSKEYKDAKNSINWKRFTSGNSFKADSNQPRDFDWDNAAVTKDIPKNEYTLYVHSNLYYTLEA